MLKGYIYTLNRLGVIISFLSSDVEEFGVYFDLY